MERNIYKIGKELFITSDEEIKEGDWVIDDEGDIFKVIEIEDIQGLVRSASFAYVLQSCKKIILTTDQDLIKDGVQAIDDEFLEWFVKNPSCDEVEVEEVLLGKVEGTSMVIFKYKIIIPKEEPKQHVEFINNNIDKLDKAIKSFKQDSLNQFLSTSGVMIKDPQKWEIPKQETLEEAAENYKLNTINAFGDYQSFIAGAKWQQEQDKNKYSKEEVPKNLESVLAKITHQNDLGLSQWCEVVYYDNDADKWCCYSGSKTFQDGERVIAWKYCKDLI